MTYKEAGVDVERGARFAEGLHEVMQRTFGERVVSNPGGFGALFSLDYDERLFRHNYAHPILVSATDGVGTKLKVAFMAGRHDTVGIDLVAMCVNDILTLGAEPLFLLDYLATGCLEPEVLRQVVEGVAAGCRQAGCALLGGETAEMPDFYQEGEYDMAGFVVGVVERRRLMTGLKVTPGDVMVGLPSSGLHSNGYSLARRLFFEVAGMGCGDSLARFGIDRTLGEELLIPTKIYVRAVRTALRHYKVKQVIGAIAHVTGGGLLENIPRVLPEGCGVELDPSSWRRPAVFDAIQQIGQVPEREMYRTFNMGIGMVLIVSPYYAASVARQLRRAGERPEFIGRVVPGERRVEIS
jgi:phosphoribosylformylglycinamidine cyclo-ligase